MDFESDSKRETEGSMGEDLVSPSSSAAPQRGVSLHPTGIEPGSHKRRSAFYGFFKKLFKPFRSVRKAFVSSIGRRIILLNMLALAALLAIILYLNQFREGLIDAKFESLRTTGLVIAAAIAAQATAEPDAITIDPEKLLELKRGESLAPRLDSQGIYQAPIDPEQVAPVLRGLITPTRTRARIYDPDGVLVLDSRFLYAGGQAIRSDLPPLGGAPQSREEEWLSSAWLANWLNRILRDDDIPPYRDLPPAGELYPEVRAALEGVSRPVVRQTPDGELRVSVAVPIQRFRANLGVLLLSTEGDDINRTIAEERLAILRIFLVAAITMLILSVLLASTIARPLRQLSGAALKVKRGSNNRVDIPDFSSRTDEIGDLSNSISEMTNALYQRIEAIERFAADVSHELKNPLTSLRSAVETLPVARTPDAKRRLMEVIQHDVQRLDRLITDIADASRLDADLVREGADVFDFADLLENLVSASREVRLRRGEAQLVLVIDRQNQGRKGYRIKGHDNRLAQVVNNLVDNAVSFVPKENGRIAIGLTRNASQLVLVVEDNGPGIQAEDLDRVFERFYTDRSEQSGFGQNSGLGLSISRQIVEAHGGSIRAENRKEKSGARFILRLPLDREKK